jgi:integrase
MPEHQWPEADRLAWERARRRGSLLEDGGLAANWRATTQATAAKGYGRWLTFLISRNLLDPDAAPAERVTRERVEAYVADLVSQGNASGTVHIRILQLCRMLDVISLGNRPAWLNRILAKTRAVVLPTRDDRARLLPASVLLDLARSLITRAETSDLPPRLRAVTYRDGLLIMILLASALRVGNLAALRLGHSFVRRDEEWWILFEGHETKNHRRIEMPLPAQLTPMIEHYLAVWRPVLFAHPGMHNADAASNPGFLWLGRYGGKFGPKKIAKRFGEVTLREFGHAMNPHLLRKLVATELAIQDPAHVGIAQPMLTHSTYETTQKAYNLAQSIDAARRVQATMASLRQSATKPERA